MNDKTALIEAIDAELRRALAVAPSADFTARLRRRVAEEPRPSFWPQGLRLAAVGVASIAIWFAASVARPPAGDRPVATAAPAPAAGPIESIAASSPLVRLAGAPDSRGTSGAGRGSPREETLVEAPAPEAAVPVASYRWASSADTRFVVDSSFTFPMATTLESAPVAGRDVREPNEGLLEGEAADKAMTNDFRWSEQ